MIDAAGIVNGIREEIRATPKHVDFRVDNRVRDGSVWTLSISGNDKARNELDESLEGARVWWKDTPSGYAEVLSVVPDQSQVNLRFASAEPPDRGGKIVVNLPQYLEKLEEVWLDGDWSSDCVRWLEKVEARNPTDSAKRLSTKAFPWLRRAQKDAFDLPARKISFLHGPPGTGKTRTLGALIAQYLVAFPKERILLLSTTNVAVDEAILSVDKALSEVSDGPRARRIRQEECKRIGNHFVASKYKGRDHLLPKQDTSLLEELIRLETKRPPEDRANAYAVWKSMVEAIRAKMRANAVAVLSESRVVAMTTTRAVFAFDELLEHFPADLIVFDESSQVGLAHALALAPIGKRAIFTGDPNQLSPICRSEVEDSSEWLGESMFSRQRAFADATCFLDEQSRMAEPICHVVSKTFYGSKLKVAADCDREWRNDRDLSESPVEKRAVSIRTIDGKWNYSAKFGGFIRFDSAVGISEMIGDLATGEEVYSDDLLVLTPFRAQRRLIKSRLKIAGIRGVRVSTVHKAQGSECHTVIFDPVDGANPFLNTDDAERLINVALSRAKARLIVFLSNADLSNPVLKKVHSVVNNLAGILHSTGIPRSKGRKNRSRDLILRKDFPHCALQKELAICLKDRDIVGRVTSVSADGAKFHLFEYESGETKPFVTAYVKKNAIGG